jgi:hypothetical protein
MTSDILAGLRDTAGSSGHDMKGMNMKETR